MLRIKVLLIKKACIWKNFPDFRYSQYRPSCIQDVSSSPNLHGMEARTEKSRNQCHVLTISKNVPICLSPIQPNTAGIVKTAENRDQNYIGGTLMAITSMVYSSSEHVYPQSDQKDLLMGTWEKNHPSRLLAWLFFGNNWYQKTFQTKLQSLYQVPEEKVQSLLTNQPEASGPAGAENRRLIPFDLLQRLL